MQGAELMMSRTAPMPIDPAASPRLMKPHVRVIALGDARTAGAYAAGRRVCVAVQRLGELHRERGLAQVRRPDEEVGVVEAALCERAFQGLDGELLAVQAEHGSDDVLRDEVLVGLAAAEEGR